METLSYIVLILLTLVGYSSGAVSRAGKTKEIKPRFADLIILLVLLTAAIYSRTSFDLNKWLLILIWVLIGILIGFFAASFRKLPEATRSDDEIPEEKSLSFLKRAWENWKGFSGRMGSFQSRVLLSFFFFIFVTPFAAGVRIFSDPLGIKKHDRSTHWSPKKENTAELEHFKRQF
jgi:hypothetical protein